MNIEDRYRALISQLKLGKQPRLPFSLEEKKQLFAFWQSWIDNSERCEQELQPLLCLLSHSKDYYPELLNFFITSFQIIEGDETTVFLLGASQLHIIQGAIQAGERFPYEYIMALKPLLIAKAPQVNEWALRAVADLGPQSILLKDAILELRPGAMRVFSGQQKTIHQLIGHIQDSWPKV